MLRASVADGDIEGLLQWLRMTMPKRCPQYHFNPGPTDSPSGVDTATPVITSTTHGITSHRDPLPAGNPLEVINLPWVRVTVCVRRTFRSHVPNWRVNLYPHFQGTFDHSFVLGDLPRPSPGYLSRALTRIRRAGQNLLLPQSPLLNNTMRQFARPTSLHPRVTHSVLLYSTN
ncbi:hypothetical protein BC826DRAFT_1030238 [Russula brevipes]|nr:hypothetical protein BC826DRAFT_1030238 [Russula brevipes]